MSKSHLLLAVVLVTTLILIFSGWSKEKTEATPKVKPCLRISAAVSLKTVLEEARPLLSQATGLDVQYTFGGSGALAAQIARGAPVDIFISADRVNVQNLAEKGLVDPASVTVVASNTLVLVVPAGTSKVLSLSDLHLQSIHRIAIGEPVSVPAGRYAKQTLEYHHLWKEFHDGGKLVMGENVSQVLAYVARGEVDAGFVYHSDVLPAAGKVTLVSEMLPHSHEPIEYVFAVVTESPAKNTALTLRHIWHGPAMQQILNAHGFTPVTPTTTSPAP